MIEPRGSGRRHHSTERFCQQLPAAHHPSGCPGPPGQPPQGRHDGRVCCDIRLDRLIRCVGCRDIDHGLNKSGGEATGKLVTLDDQCSMPSPSLRRSEANSSPNVIIVELCVEPARLAEFDQGVDRARRFPVDQSNRQPIPGDDIPRTQIAMPVDSAITSKVPTIPGPPDGIGARAETVAGVVKPPQQGAQDGQGRLGPRGRMHETTIDIGQLLPSVLIEAASDHPRRALKPSGFQMAEKGMDCG